MPLSKIILARLKRAVAMFMILTVVNQLLAPSIAMALTSGPTAPEATNFEPIDTTDMVNGLTGNFTYSIPLLEVPGPEGGYPLALAYHSGVQPDMDASWAGLGWSLNPGAIARSVNGFPDDFSDVDHSKRDYWVGGNRSTFSNGIGLYNGVNFGLSISQDTYQGFGIGGYVGYGYNLGFANIGGDISVDPYGGVNAGVSLSVGATGSSGLGLGVSVGLSTNFHSVSGNMGVGLSTNGGGIDENSNPLLGISMSTSSGKVNLSIAGASSNVYNAKSGKISTSSSGFGFIIPTYYFYISLGYNYTRYWSDETDSILTNGALYSPQYVDENSTFNTHGYDTYRLNDPINSNIVDNPDPDKAQGGSFPEFDNYMVTAQGLGGSIRPFIYQSAVYSQNRPDVNQANGVSPLNMVPVHSIQFRFLNDFSNSYTQGHPDFSSAQGIFATPVHGNNDGDYGYNSYYGQLLGSKHIAYYTNFQINSGEAKTNGFIDVAPNSGGFVRKANNYPNGDPKDGKQVGGFTITNESGVSYHYALPAYTYNQFSKVSQTGGNQFSSETITEPYAYTWYLTAVTGPDFVDKNDNGIADAGDWGYWVTFDYGKWTSDYHWRNPSQDVHTDVDPNFNSYSEGDKELYYLDAIKTRTHTAVFIKEKRYDSNGINGRPTLGLNSIVLLQNDQIGGITTNYMRAAGFDGTTGCVQDNVIDLSDLPYITGLNLTQSAIRRIQFNHDYSLSPLPNGSGGKYSLLSVDFQGKGGASLSPPIEFGYDLDQDDTANQDLINYSSTTNNFNQQGVIQVNTANKFKPGDVIRIEQTPAQGPNIKYWCTILSPAFGTNKFNVVFLGYTPSAGSYINLLATKTKNPPYQPDHVDAWGMFKSDYVPIANNYNKAHQTTILSNLNTDAWCLRSVQTSIGASFKINYEGNTYLRSVLAKNKSVVINSGTVNSSNNTITLNLPNPDNIDFTTIYSVGQAIDAVLLNQYTVMPYTYKNAIQLSNVGGGVISNISGNSIEIKVTSAFFASLNPSVTNTIVTGNIESSAIAATPGGGLRVKDLTIDDLNGAIRKTSYNYNLPSTASGVVFSSGVTSYEPVVLDNDNIYAYLNASNSSDATVIKDYRRFLYKGINDVVTFARDAPAPGVMYEYVTVSESNVLPNGTEVPVEGKTMSQYRVFNRGMIGIKQYQYSSPTSTLTYKNLSLKDYTSQVGNLVRTVQYDKSGNKLTEIINNYLNDDIVDQSFDVQVNSYEQRLASYSNQGFIQERYSDGRSFDTGGGNWIYKVTMSGRDQYPIIGTGTTKINYLDGTTISQRDIGFDFYSGAITKTLNTDSYGNRFINEVTPAYRVYPAMGLRQNNGALPLMNKNMLSQEAANYTYAVDQSNAPIGVIAATATTWSNTTPVLDPDGITTTQGQGTIWRKGGSYSWFYPGSTANNMTPYGSFIDYFTNAASSTPNPNWKKTGQITKYNVYSAALEAQGGPDNHLNYSATRMGYKSSKVLISGGPALYDEIAFAGAEDALLTNGNFSNNVGKGAGSISTDTLHKHTGSNALLVPATGNGFTYTLPLTNLDQVRKSYSAAVWVEAANATDAAQSKLCYQVGTNPIVQSAGPTKYACGWYLLELNVPSTALTGSGNLVVWCQNNSTAAKYFDDFRFQPTAASTTAYVYDNRTGEINYMLGNNDMYIRYQYDEIGRLIRVYKEVLGKAPTSPAPRIKSYNYNYGKTGKAKWQNTTTTRCQQAGGTNNGLTDVQQTDVNPLSPTYNQTRWAPTMTPSSGCPVTIYARLDALYGTVTGPYGYTYGNYSVKLFSDPNGNFPYTVTGGTVAVNYKITQDISDANNNPSNNTITGICYISSGQNGNGIGNVILHRCNSPDTSPFIGGGGGQAAVANSTLAETSSSAPASENSTSTSTPAARKSSGSSTAVASPQVVQPPGGGNSPYCMNNAIMLTPGSYTIIYGNI